MFTHEQRVTTRQFVAIASIHATLATLPTQTTTPQIYTIWNFRREALDPVFVAGGDAAVTASDGELSLTSACLLENPKSYSAWHHRKWVVAKGLCDLHSEMRLVARALSADGRNFHAWNYRQFVARLLGSSPEDELDFSEEKVAEDFSNYSAWHYRTILLPRIHGGAGGSAPPAAPPPQPSSSSAAPGRDGGGGNNDSGGGAGMGASSTAGMHRQFLGQATGGSASQRAPIPLDVLDAEYDVVHQVWIVYGGGCAHAPGVDDAGVIAPERQRKERPCVRAALPPFPLA
eukprot:365355-Chlamydomonas_euryale.AAC.14